MHRSRVLRGFWLSVFAGICFANCNPHFARKFTRVPRLGDRGRYVAESDSFHTHIERWLTRMPSPADDIECRRIAALNGIRDVLGTPEDEHGRYTICFTPHF